MIRKRREIPSKKQVKWYSCILLALIIAATCALPPLVFADSEDGTGADDGEANLAVQSSEGIPGTAETTITFYKTTVGGNSPGSNEFEFSIVRVADKAGKKFEGNDTTEIKVKTKPGITASADGKTITLNAEPNVTAAPVEFTIKNLTLSDNATDEQEHYFYEISESKYDEVEWEREYKAFVVRIIVCKVADELMVPRQGQEWFFEGVSYDKKGGGNPVPPNEYNTFVNTYIGSNDPSGKLNIKKNDFNPTPASAPAYRDETFQFTIKQIIETEEKTVDLTDSNIKIRKVGPNGAYLGSNPTQGIFTLAYNTEVQITGLPHGTYAIYEADAGYTVSYVINKNNSVTGNKATVQVNGGIDNTVVFTNVETDKGTRLTVKKKLDGEFESWGVGEKTMFRAKIQDARGRYMTFSGAAPDYKYTGTSITGSEIRFSVEQPAVIINIPIGTVCTVEEIAFGGTPCKREYDKNDVIISKDADETIVVTNIFDIDTRKVGKLTIKKQLIGSMNDWGVDENTVFTARVKDITVAGDEYDLHFERDEDGNYEAVPIGTGTTEIQFTAGKLLVLSELWTDRVYVVEETGGAGYEAEYHGNEAVIPEGGNMSVTITNTYKAGNRNLVISKKLAGSPGDWGVDENTVFSARVKDTKVGKYILFEIQPDGSYLAKGNSNSDEPSSDPKELVRFKAGSPAVISGLNSATLYKVEEQVTGTHYTPAYSPENVSLPSAGNANVVITNTYNHGVGNLVIRKKLAGFPDDWRVDEDTIFRVRVKDVTDNNDNNYLLFIKDVSNGTYRAFANNGSPTPGIDPRELVPLSAGNPVIMTGLWANRTYVVEEAEEEGGLRYDTICEGDNQMIPVGGNMNVTLTNTFEPGAGRLIITKKLAGSPGDWGVDNNTDFRVRVKEMPEGNYVLFDLQPDGGYKAKGSSGSNKPTDDPRELVRITARRAYVLSGLEPNRKYMVEEVGGARYTVAYDGNNEMLLKDSNMGVTLTNTFRPNRPNTTTNTDEPDKGSLVITKRLAGSPGDWDVDGNTVFSARVKDVTNRKYVLLELQPDGSYLAVGNSNSATPTNDSREFVRFTSGAPVTIKELPSNCVYAVEEVSGAHYTAAYTGNNVMLPDGGAMGVTVTNTYGNDGGDNGGDDGDDDGGDDGGDNDNGNGGEKGRLVVKKASFNKTPAKPREAFTFYVKKNGAPVDLTAVGIRIRKTGGSGEYIAVDLRNGSFTLTYDTEVTVDGLPLGRYTVAEYAVGYIKSCKLTDNSILQTDGTVISDITVTFTNEEIDADSPRPSDGSADDYFEIDVPLVPLAEIRSPQIDTGQDANDEPQTEMPTTGISTKIASLFLLMVVLIGAAAFIYFRIRAIKKTIENEEP